MYMCTYKNPFITNYLMLYFISQQYTIFNLWDYALAGYVIVHPNEYIQIARLFSSHSHLYEISYVTHIPLRRQMPIFMTVKMCDFRVDRMAYHTNAWLHCTCICQTISYALKMNGNNIVYSRMHWYSIGNHLEHSMLLLVCVTCML